MLSPGDLVAGKYRIERPLGEGGMGAVFVAVNEKLKKRVALKLLRREVANLPGAAERFTREAIAASSAKHPGLIEIYDADTHEGLPWIAMELLEGESLAERMERGRIPLDELLGIACEALAALAHVHRAGIIHRDLKPDNLFLEQLPEGGRRVKILDFGIAASSGPELARVTQTGMAIGTPAYLAPEQAAGQSDLDGRVDVYAMGVILFELIAGRLPYPAHSVGEMVMLMYTKGPPSLAQEVPSVPPGLAAIVDMCLAIDRADRVQSTESLRRELESLRPLVRALGTAATYQLPVTSSSPVTPVGSPDFASGLPRTHTPQEIAYAATVHAPATPPGSVPGVGGYPAPAAGGSPATFVPAYATPHPATSATPHPTPPHPTPHPAPYSSPPPRSHAQSEHGSAPAHVAARAPSGARVVAILAAAVVLVAVVIGAVAAVAIVVVAGEQDERVASASASSTAPVAPMPAEPVPAMEPIAPVPAVVPDEGAPEEPDEQEPRVQEPHAQEPRAQEPSSERSDRRTNRDRTVREPRVARAPDPTPPAPEPAEPAARPLDNATIVRVLESNEARLDRCYFDAHPQRPRPRVRTEVDLSIGRDGRVTDSSVVSGQPLLDACVRRVLSGVRFPAHQWPTRARFPMTFVDEE